ncbi:MAG: hypothetical protein R3E79_48850 [Caldilineaceae bacterium]
MQTTWVRSGGLAALVAGLLRAVNSFIPGTTARVELLYLATDLALLLALIGLARWLPKPAGRWGRYPFWAAFAGIGILIVRDLAPGWAALYPPGALLLAGGLCWLAVAHWHDRAVPRWILAFWLLSTLIGVVGFFTPGLTLLFVVAGVLFGLSFIGIGLRMILLARNDPDVA